ncbi:MAG: glycoside hydrolase family 57 protein [Myxococcales bacterium]
MSSVCFYFEVHQPYRVRPYDVFQVGAHHDYFDERLNREILQKVATKCYLPANETILELIERTEGRFRVSYAITGVALEQMEAYAPEVVESFQRLVETGAVELLGETYHHSLASLYDPLEFRAQVELHTRLMQTIFGVTPRVLANTELIYDDAIGREVAALGFQGMLAEGADDILAGGLSPNLVYRAAGDPTLALLLKNYRLSDDIAFRFSDRSWDHYPLAPETFAGWLHRAGAGADSVNLFMDYETFGEHQASESGIFQFLQQLPEAVLSEPGFGFKTPSEVIATSVARSSLSFPRTVSWADNERDLSAWCGNEMQTRALERVHGLRERIAQHNQPGLLALWRKLTTSDHYYYMCTKWFGDADVHAYFSPYESPYEAFINFSNIVSDLEESLLKLERTDKSVIDRSSGDKAESPQRARPLATA